MAFWIFMLIMILLTPLTMLGFGSYFVKSSPKEINGVFGYRTSMSMKNQDTWVFAHHYCGKLWRRIGRILVVVSVISMLFVLGKTKDEIGNFGSVICMIQMTLLIGSIFPTERALNKTFDKEGKRRENDK